MNKDLRSLSKWLNANKISLNITKTEVLIFKRKSRVFGTDLNLKLCGKKLFTSKSVKYLGVILDKHLQWIFHINQLWLKLNKANSMLCEICHYVNETTLRSIYYAIVQSQLSCVCAVWGQNIKYNHRIRILQRKAMRIIFFSDFNDYTTPLFSKSKILKFIDFIQMDNCIFLNKSVSSSLHSLFSQVYLFANDHHNYKTRFASNGPLKISTVSIYGTKSFETSAITSSNFFQSHFTDINLKETSVNQVKHWIKNHFFNLYDNSVT